MGTRRSQAEWAQLVMRFEASGKSAEAFAATNDLNPRTLKWWRSQLRAGSLYRARRSKDGVPKSVSKKGPSPRRVPGKPKALPQMTERLVDGIAVEPGLSALALALSLRFEVGVILDELRALERLGILVRRGRGPGARWYLG